MGYLSNRILKKKIMVSVAAAWLVVAAITVPPQPIAAAEPIEERVAALLRAGVALAANTYYLEALDHLNEARDLLETSRENQTRLFGDILFAIAQVKIKGRLHQGFPAAYVKSALKDVQACNNLREKIPGVLPQQLAESYYLEGYILKRFFMRNEEALSCFVKAVSIDPGSSAAKRELSELMAGQGDK